MKYIYLTVMMLATVVLSGLSGGEFFTLSFEPSGINRAIGGDVVGVVNVWHHSPLTASANPAVNAFHEGVAYGYTRDRWGELPGYSPMYYNASLASVGYKGVALLLPVINGSDQWGVTFDIEDQAPLNNQGEVVTKFKFNDHASIVGFAVNPIDLYRNLKVNHDKWLDHFDLAYGSNYLKLKAETQPEVTGFFSQYKASTSTINAGGIARFNYNIKEAVGMEAVLGLADVNTRKKEVTFGGDSEPGPVWYSRSTGYALAASLKGERFTSTFLPESLRFFENLMTLRYLNASMKPMGNEDEVITGSGTEIGLLDTFYIRNGNYDDDAGEINGKTKGYGINIHYKNLVGFCYNYAEMPGGSLLGTQKSEDYSVNIDFVNLLQLVRN